MSTPARGLTHHELPPENLDLARFPTRSVAGRWFRAHLSRSAADEGCWWFSSAGTPAEEHGRFDLPDPHGTCYLASSAQGAARERVGTQIRKSRGQESVLASVLTGPQDGRPVLVSAMDLARTGVANLAVQAAQKWINRSLMSGTGIYAVTQAWAAAFAHSGFAGLCYEPRFALGERQRALALFGAAGAPRAASEPGPVVQTLPLGHVLTEAGVRVVHPPRLPTAVLPAGQRPPPL